MLTSQRLIDNDRNEDFLLKKQLRNHHLCRRQGLQHISELPPPLVRILQIFPLNMFPNVKYFSSMCFQISNISPRYWKCLPFSDCQTYCCNAALIISREILPLLQYFPGINQLQLWFQV